MKQIVQRSLRLLSSGLLCCGVAAALCTACSDDGITPSPNNHLIEFPQGTNAYDQTIKGIYDQYGTQILYRYNDAMFRWQITDLLTYYTKPADEGYVAQAVDFLQDNCLSLYPKDSLRHYLPYRIYLAADLGRLFEYSGLDAAGNSVNTRDTLWHTAATNGYDNLCFALASPRIATLSADSLKLAKGELNAALISYCIGRGIMAVPAAFSKEEVSGVAWNNYIGSYNTYGLIEYLNPKTFTAAQDFAIFVKYLIAYTDDEFNARFTVKSFDTSGRIARKAKAAREWLNTTLNEK